MNTYVFIKGENELYITHGKNDHDIKQLKLELQKFNQCVPWNDFKSYWNLEFEKAGYAYRIADNFDFQNKDVSIKLVEVESHKIPQRGFGVFINGSMGKMLIMKQSYFRDSLILYMKYIERLIKGIDELRD